MSTLEMSREEKPQSARKVVLGIFGFMLGLAVLLLAIKYFVGV